MGDSRLTKEGRAKAKAEARTKMLRLRKGKAAQTRRKNRAAGKLTGFSKKEIRALDSEFFDGMERRAEYLKSQLPVMAASFASPAIGFDSSAALVAQKLYSEGIVPMLPRLRASGIESAIALRRFQSNLAPDEIASLHYHPTHLFEFSYYGTRYGKNYREKIGLPNEEKFGFKNQRSFGLKRKKMGTYRRGRTGVISTNLTPGPVTEYGWETHGARSYPFDKYPTGEKAGLPEDIQKKSGGRSVNPRPYWFDRRWEFFKTLKHSWRAFRGGEIFMLTWVKGQTDSEIGDAIKKPAWFVKQERHKLLEMGNAHDWSKQP